MEMYLPPDRSNGWALIFMYAFLISELLVLMVLLFIGTRDAVYVRRFGNRSASLRAFIGKRQKLVMSLGYVGLFWGIAYWILPPLFYILLDWFRNEDRDPLWTLGFLLYSWECLFVGLIPFAVGKLIRLYYRQVARNFLGSVPNGTDERC